MFFSFKKNKEEELYKNGIIIIIVTTIVVYGLAYPFLSDYNLKWKKI